MQCDDGKVVKATCGNVDCLGVIMCRTAMMDELEVTVMQHDNNDLRIQHAQEVCDYAARFRPGNRISAGRGNALGIPGVWVRLVESILRGDGSPNR